MNINVKKSTEEIIIEVEGRLDTTTAPNLDQAINDSINNTKKLVLDIKALEYISSAGLRVLLIAQKKMQNMSK